MVTPKKLLQAIDLIERLKKSAAHQLPAVHLILCTLIALPKIGYFTLIGCIVIIPAICDYQLHTIALRRRQEPF